jgi:hypothetical protein
MGLGGGVSRTYSSEIYQERWWWEVCEVSNKLGAVLGIWLCGHEYIGWADILEGVRITGVTISHGDGVQGVFIPMQHPWISAFIVVCFVSLVSSFFQRFLLHLSCSSFGFDMGEGKLGVDNEVGMDGLYACVIS